MKNKTLLSILALLLLGSLAFTSCDNNATGQDGDQDVDFIQNVVSGSVIGTTEDGDLILQLELSPITTFFAENPGFEAGIINTDNFFVLFDEIFSSFSPNSVLALRENGSAVSIPISLSEPDYDPETGVVEYIAKSLEFTPTTTFMGDSIVSRSIEDLDSPFGPAFLFIDSGSLNFGGACGDGGGLICPIGIGGGDPCINTNTTVGSPDCCNLGGSVTCSNCSC